MITSKLTEQSLFTEINSTAKNTGASRQTATVVKRNNSAHNDPADSVIIHKKHFEFFNSRPAYSKVNLMAATVRSADATMQKIDKQIEQMKNRLLEYVKQYPPFGQNRQERMKLLKLFSAFRKQIDQLTIPVDNFGAMKIMADPATHSDAGDWDIDLDTQGHHVTIRSQQVHTGPGGLNIPELPGESTHEEIQASINNLESAQATLSQRRGELAANFEQILDHTRLWK
jgi:hypothetical protein